MHPLLGGSVRYLGVLADKTLYLKGTMRTIKQNLMQRMAMQASEAEVQGLHKVADALTNQVENHANRTRDDDAFYVYADSDFRKDVEEQLWAVMVRAADFYGVRFFDAREINEIVESTADDMISNFRKKVGVRHGVGAYEPEVPGQPKHVVSIEIDEE